MQDIPVTLRRIRHELAEMQRDLETATRQVEVADAALVLRVDGKNEGERKARLVLFRVDDHDYLSALARVDWVKAEIKRLEVEEAFIGDLRRANEWEIRRRQADALIVRSKGNAASDPTIDEAVDDDIPF